MQRRLLVEKDQNEAFEESLDFNSPSFQFIPKGSHQWRQQGPYIICKSCELEHAAYIGMEHLMTGIDERGMPILKNRI